jgi:MscS family membrane protein
LRGTLLLAFFWACAGLIDVGGHMLARTPWARTRPSSRSFINMGTRVLKVAVLAIAVVALFAELGFPVASIIAGLGLGGLAFALAAQKTVENLFGAFSIGIDQPIREGDFVKIEDFQGTVEHIGFRSTRVRTLDRTVITMPNGKLADMRLESFAERDRFRFFTVMRLSYATTASQLRTIIAGVEEALKQAPHSIEREVVVRLAELSNDAMLVNVIAMFDTVDGGEFERARQDVLLAIMDTVEKAGATFAFPTQTLELSRGTQPLRRAPRVPTTSESARDDTVENTVPHAQP